MTDKEVGELWRYLSNKPVHTVHPSTVIRLIRKLVDDRAAYVWACSGFRDSRPSSEKAALVAFGIDPDLWRSDAGGEKKWQRL